MAYGELPTPELVIAAEQEVENFSLPWGTLRRLDLVEGYAIDTSSPADHDDAISVSRTDAGQTTLHVSISNVAGSIDPRSAISALARRRLYTVYRGEGILRPMLPKPVSEHLLSLKNGEPRPVVTFSMDIDQDGGIGDLRISQDVLVARGITYAQAEKKLAKDADPHLSELEVVAKALLKGRSHGLQSTARDEQGRLISESSRATFIVQEAMIAANTALPRYFIEHGIPGLFRVQTRPNDRETDNLEAAFEDYPDESLIHLMMQANPAYYSVQPQEHIGLGIESGYMHITSPIRRYADFVNHMNLRAHRMQERYPFPRQSLSHIASRINRFASEARQARSSFIDSDGGIRTEQANRGRPKPASAKAILDRAASGKASELDLAKALFGDLSGSDDVKRTLRETVATLINNDFTIARQILHVSLLKGWLSIDGMDKTPKIVAGNGQQPLIVADRLGNRFSYLPHRNKVENYRNVAKLIGEIVGLSLDPKLPERFSRDYGIRENPLRYLVSMDRGHGLRIKHAARNNPEDDSFTLTVNFYVNGKQHLRSATADSKKAAAKMVGSQIIEEFDLIDNPPPILPKLPRRNTPGYNGNIHNPVSILSLYLQLQRLPPITWDITFSGDTRAGSCRLMINHADGTTQILETTGRSKQEMKEQAALEAIRTMPDAIAFLKEKLKNRK